MSLDQIAHSRAPSAADTELRPAARWDGPLFVVGMPRSGTKLLRGLLLQHPRVRIPTAETDFLPFIVEWVERHGEPQTDNVFERLSNDMRHATYFVFRPKTRGPFSWREWQAACGGHFDVAGLFEGFLRYELDIGRGSGIIWGDKSPAYIRHIPMLLQLFPSARIVHIIRDVRDHCVSMRKAWNKDIRRAAWRWGTDVLQAHKQCVATPNRCLEVRFEDLLQQPEQQMRRLCAFLDLDFFQGLSDLKRSVENRGDATGRAEIVRDNFNKFEARLTPAELADVESLAYTTMTSLGYEAQRAQGQSDLTPVMQQWLRLKDGLQLVVGGMQRRGLAASIRFHATHSRMAGR